MEKLIPVVNRLQDVLNAVGADPLGLPQLAVVGSQSSGKSSVLEGLVGRDFLPRGTGIVTRRPLVLQLIHVPDAKPGKGSSGNASSDSNDNNAPPLEWGEFLHKPNEMFTDFDDIRREIEEETDREAGANKGISDRPINLKIYSPNVVNLTLVDLPGIAKVPVGDQPEDIERRIRDLIMTYISKPDTLILTVSAANADLANSDGLQLARMVDPKNERTIGVITKLDLMDQGSEQGGLDMLTGRVIPLKLGFIGVVNRSQKDIDSKKRIRDAIRAEAKFFSQHPVFRILSSRCGMGFLAKSLNTILINHIRDTLPTLRQRVLRMLHEAENELAGYGEDILGEGTRGALVLQVITRFAQLYADAIDGRLGATVIPVAQAVRRDARQADSADGKKSSSRAPLIATTMTESFHNPLQQTPNELYGGARLHHLFTEIFAKRLSSVEPSGALSAHMVRATMRNATGPRGALFVPESAFEVLTKREIVRLEDPSLQCVEFAHAELQRIVSQLETRELLRFPRLRDEIVGASLAVLDELRSPCKNHVSACIAVEASYINTAHPDFIGGDGAIKMTLQALHDEQQQQLQPQQSLSPPEHVRSQPGAPPRAIEGPAPQPRSQPPSQPDYQQGGQASIFNMFFGGKNKDKDNSQPSSGHSERGGASSSAPDRTASAPTDVAQSLRTNMTSEEVEERRRRREERKRKAMQRAGQSQHMDAHLPSNVSPLSSQATEKEEIETRLILCLIASYFDVVRKSVSDSVPKTIMHFMVNMSKQRLQSELVARLYKDERFDELLSESTSVAERRLACKKMVDVLQRANRILNEVREYQA